MIEKIEQRLKENPSMMDDMMKQLDRAKRTARGNARLIKAESGSGAAICVAPHLVDISVPSKGKADPPIGISVIEGTGTLLRGPVGFTETPSGIRVAGMWTFNDLLLSTAASTLLTPIPVMKFSPPAQGIAEIAASSAALAIVVGLAI